MKHSEFAKLAEAVDTINKTKLKGLKIIIDNLEKNNNYDIEVGYYIYSKLSDGVEYLCQVGVKIYAMKILIV